MIRRAIAVTAIGSIGLLGVTALPAAGKSMHKGSKVNLIAAKGELRFKPSVLNATVAPGKSCNSRNYEYSITNKTSASQNVDLNGNPFTTMIPGQVLYLCSNVGETQTYTVPSTPATLTVNTSAAS